MEVSNINIRTEKEIKEKATALFEELGLSMTTAINIFLKTAIRENGFPFSLQLKMNEEMRQALIESEQIAKDRSRKRYKSIEELKEALEV